MPSLRIYLYPTFYLYIVACNVYSQLAYQRLLGQVQKYRGLETAIHAGVRGDLSSSRLSPAIRAQLEVLGGEGIIAITRRLASNFGDRVKSP